MIIKLLFNTTETMLKDRGLEPTGRVQKIVDSEVLRRSDPYVPFKTGYLKSSGIRGTKIGSGEVMYNAVYAHTNYYLNAGKGKQGTASGGLRTILMTSSKPPKKKAEANNGRINN